ncbi:MAG TPA: GAF domain-containing protein [Gemmatimonadaceae bacterium]|nr:GAF domain-containing protein [Gemmatimonadaceae bacterium]
MPQYAPVSPARAETLLRITGAIADAVSAEQVYEAVVDHVGEALGASSVALWIVDRAHESVSLVRAVGYTETARHWFDNVPLSTRPTFPALDAIRTGEPVWIPSQGQLVERYAHLALFATPGRSYRISALPLVTQGTVVGALGLTIEQPGESSEEERDFLLLIARYAGQAVERLRLHNETHDARVRAEQLYRFAQAVVAADRIESVYEAALSAIETALSADRAAILTYDHDEIMKFRAWRNLSDSYRSAVEGHSPWPRTATAPEPVLVPDARRDPALAAYAPLFEREKIGALAFIPLFAERKLLGKFMFYFERAHTFTERELETARSIANHLASVMARFDAVAKLEDTIRSNELFAGVLAHDLRNPLDAMLTSAQLLLMQREGSAPSDAALNGERKPASRILASGQRMTAMINQLLDFTRARSGGGMRVEPRATNLGELYAQASSELELAHPGWTIQCTPSGDLSGNWDADRLLQVFSNVIGNAGQHGTPGAAIHVHLDGSAPDHVRLEVRNEGAVPAAILPNLFDPFRSTRHGRGQSSGLGLGLYIVREIIRAHGGTIDVTSSEERGTTFSVVLPR